MGEIFWAGLVVLSATLGLTLALLIELLAR